MTESLDLVQACMHLALEQAKLASLKDEVPVGAVILFNDQVVAQAHNAKEQDQNPIGHAEILALLQAAKTQKSWRLIDCDLYVTLEPCAMCLAAIQHARIRRVYYGVSDPKMGAISLGYTLNQDVRMNHRFEAICLEQPECGKILSDFFKKKRKKAIKKPL